MGLCSPSENFGHKVSADACDSRWWELKWFELFEIYLPKVSVAEDENFVYSNHVQFHGGKV